jgi:hypothetical protein
MSEFTGPPMSWYNPPDVHEICKCEDCHDEMCHEGEEKDWAKWGCYSCEEILAQKEIVA